ncbi:MAG: pyridoxamine 5'-phosphate oxidase family protein [Firmicutes bacterium]|nr:pyridoxamine 5'-phosphate oxidase family protein [Clostridia bacterium]MBS5021900.1 pyridoxamine 5'-phosphate oxidase family protein [Bacillota bacterium]
MIAKEKIFEFIGKRGVAFIASVDEAGFPNMKAMLPPRKIEENCLYFTTNTSSLRVSQYRENPKASVYFFEKGRFRYEGVMLIGTMEVLEDAETKEEIWRTGDTMYYKKGVDDPDYCVLKFTALRGRRYCAFKSESFEL